ncbi:MAG: sec-independent translocase [Jatrophihabitantaceae bacterium]
MFNIGPFEMLVLAAVALIVFGPDKLPQLAKDAARMLRTLRDLAHGARSQLNDELGPEFADFDLRSLNPRTAIRNALLGDEDLTALNPREAISRALRGEDEPTGAPSNPRSGSGPNPPSGSGPNPRNGSGPNPPSGVTAQQPAPGRPAPYDADAT